ncbi:Uncharacterised protein [Shigella sonnei]|nr:Uncharacterised protein [Shigella sonnei]
MTGISFQSNPLRQGRNRPVQRQCVLISRKRAIEFKTTTDKTTFTQQVRTITSIMLKVPEGSSCFLGQFHCLTPAGSGIIHDLSLATSGSPTLWCQPSFRLRCPVSK